jgi:hypothetical protein
VNFNKQEIVVLTAICRSLQTLPKASQQRVIDWVVLSMDERRKAAAGQFDPDMAYLYGVPF